MYISFWFGQTTKEQSGKTQKAIIVSSRCLKEVLLEHVSSYSSLFQVWSE